MPKKIYRMKLNEFKHLVHTAINEGLVEDLDENLDEVIVTLIPPEKKRFEELKKKKETTRLTPEEKREYAELLAKDIEIRKGVARNRTDSMFSKLEKLYGGDSDKSLDEMLDDDEKHKFVIYQRDEPHGYAARKFQSKIEKIPGLETLIASIKQKGDAAIVLKDLAMEIGGDKLRADQILAKAYKLAKDSMEEEALYEDSSFNKNSGVQGSAAKKFQSKMEKVPGLETLIAAIKQKGDAAIVLKDLAKEIGGDKLKADQILAKAYSLAKKEK